MYYLTHRIAAASTYMIQNLINNNNVIEICLITSKYKFSYTENSILNLLYNFRLDISAAV